MSLIVEALKSAERANRSTVADVVDAPPSSPSRSGGAQPGGNIMTVSEKTSVSVSRGRAERRCQKRAGVRLAVRVRPTNPKNGNFDEVLVTVNASRQSLYFTTASEHYRLGMRLRVTFPYNSAHDSVTASQDDGEVMRTEHRPGKRVGVAVQLRGPAHTVSSAVGTGPNACSRAVGERRLGKRYPLSADVVLVDSETGMRLQARCSDLSLEGCYVDTLNPFPEGTVGRIQLRRGERIFEAVARVNSSHVGMGMGLGFQELAPDQTSMLVQWLTSGHRERVWFAGPSEFVERTESLDRTQLINVLRKLLSKGILTKTDLSTLFSDASLP